jgi:hypothetical protein
LQTTNEGLDAIGNARNSIVTLLIDVDNARLATLAATPDGGIGWRFVQSARDENTAFVPAVVALLNAELRVDPRRVGRFGRN